MEDDLELSAVWGSSLPVSSQVSLKSEDLQEVHVVQEVQEIDVVVEVHVQFLMRRPFSLRVISDEEVDNDRFLCGLLQQDFSLMVLHKCYGRNEWCSL